MEAPDSDLEEKYQKLVQNNLCNTLYEESKIRNTIMTNQKLEKSKTHQSEYVKAESSFFDPKYGLTGVEILGSKNFK